MSHVLPDVLQKNLKVVFCGTAAGDVSAQVGAYYAGPGNRFWETLFAVGFTPIHLEARQFREVTKYGIGLTDLAKHTSGADKILKSTDFGSEALREKILMYQPRWLAFTSKRTAKEFYGVKQIDYGEQAEMIGETRVFVLTSPSGAARGFWDERVWLALAERVNHTD